MRSTPAIPTDFRRFAHDGYTNVFSLLPDCTRLYATETVHGDWDAQVLLLAKDAAPTGAIVERAKAEGCAAWRHSQRCRGDRGGCQTNERLGTLAQGLPGTQLYGSALANLLYDDPRWSRALPGFYSGRLHAYLADVLRWVIDNMPNLRAIACLGEHAWFLTATVLGQAAAAREAARYRDAEQTISGSLGGRGILATSHFHPARGSRAQWKLGWPGLASYMAGGVGTPDGNMRP